MMPLIEKDADDKKVNVVTWGNNFYGGDSITVKTALMGVEKIYSTGCAFAAFVLHSQLP